MIKRCIGIDIGSSHLRAVQVSRTEDEFNVEKAFCTQTRRKADSVPDMLGNLVGRHGFDKHAAVAVSMPGRDVFLRNLETSSTDTEQIYKLAKQDFPIGSQEILLQVYSQRKLTGQKYSVLVAAATRQSLRERVDLLTSAKLNPNLVDTTVSAVHSTIVVNHPEIAAGRAVIAYVDEKYLALAVTEDSDILIVRNIPVTLPSGNNANLAQKRIAEILSDEVEIAWLRVFGSGIEEDTRIYALATDGDYDGLNLLIEERLNCQVTIINPYAKVKNLLRSGDKAEICLAEGLALRLLAPEKTSGINLLEAADNDEKPELNLKKEFVTFAILTAAIVLVVLAGLFVRVWRLEAKNDWVNNEIRQVFQRALPEEKNVVRPLIQLEQKLQSLRKDYTLCSYASEVGLRPLEVLRVVAVSMPSEIKINDMLITSESVRLMGTSPSFEHVYYWQKLLQDVAHFTGADVQDVRKESESGLVHFNILVSLTTMG
jgi:Tfp pilus assembly PilM family ATPase